MRAPWRLQTSLAIVLALTAGASAASAEASTYVGRQAGPAHGAVVLSVSGARIAAKQVALACAKQGSATPARGSGAIHDGRFSVRVAYEYNSGRRSAKPSRLWATLTGHLHGATITGALSVAKHGPCSGSRYTASVSGRVASGAGAATAGTGVENEAEESTVPGGAFAEQGNYEAAFNAAWEAKIEQLCHSRTAANSEAAGQSATAATCSTFVAPETLSVPQAE